MNNRVDSIRILAWNINGAYDKLDKMHDIVNKYDIIIVSELKHGYTFSLTGFTVFRSKVISGEEHRGGVALCIRNNLCTYVYSVESLIDQVWIKTSLFPDTLLGACYIPPSDSPFFTPDAYAQIQERCINNNGIVIGDLNCRIPKLSTFNDYELTYDNNPDQGENANGKNIVQVCKHCNMYPINHAITNGRVHEGNLTFRQKDKWISQLDWAFCTKRLLKFVSQFNVLHEGFRQSNHAPISIQLDTCLVMSANELYNRAVSLTDDEYHISNDGCAKPKRYCDLNRDLFCSNLTIPDNTIFDLPVHDICQTISDTLYCACSKARKTKAQHHQNMTNADNIVNSSLDRWKWITSHDDPKAMWDSINWKGEFSRDVSNEAPTDSQFKEHFESLLLSDDEITIPYSDSYMPITDDEITPNEVIQELSKLKTNKAAGPDGIPPGIMKWLPVEWLLLMTHVFNIIFSSATYPKIWSVAKFFVIFKKGARADTNNYRGISILNAMAKLYDSVINSRLCMWFKPDVEQAGAQRGRGCVDQILTLRLIMEYARVKKQQLYVLFVDFEKAYDRVPRNKLLQLLADYGCGKIMIHAIAASLKETTSIFNSCLLAASAGVRQGGSTSCSLFTLFVNPLSRALRNIGPDGFLGNYHSLLLMDDTVIFATSRKSMKMKLNVLNNFCKLYNMKINAKKTKFIPLNTSDISPFVIGDSTIEMCTTYTYLGAIISAETIVQQIKTHINAKMCHVYKFYSFLARNTDAPFHVKRKVWEAALSSSLLYSCETWLCNNIKTAETVYMSTLKQMLGVRAQTCNDLCLIECGAADLKTNVQRRQKAYIQKVTTSDWYQCSPLKFAIDLITQTKSPMAKYLNHIRNINVNEYDNTNLCNSVNDSKSSKRVFYVQQCNPNLERHPFYTHEHCLPEVHRRAFTRLRLSSHKLRIETGRWSRLPREDRTCTCPDHPVQNEEHVVCNCNMSQQIRNRYKHVDFSSLRNFMLKNNDQHELAQICYEILKLYE